MFTAVLRSLDSARVEKKLEKMDAVLNEMHILGFGKLVKTLCIMIWIAEV